MNIRKFKEEDREAIKEIAVICFEGVSIDQNMEKLLGSIDGKDWKWRKKQQIDDEANTNPDSIFVAENFGKVVGFISTRVDPASRVGCIPNFSVHPDCQKMGIGKELMDEAIAFLKIQEMECIRIETLDQNKIGQNYYPKRGFKEIARQIHYVMRID